VSFPAPHAGEIKALEARREQGLGDARGLDILDVVEERFDVPVLVERFNDDMIAGVLLRRAGGDRFVGVNADHHTIRQRFTLAHELGHLQMGHQARVDLAVDVFGPGRNAEEVEANYFAAEFLAPRAAVRAWLEEHGLVDRAGDASTVAQLALEFGIAFAAACFRLERAGVISTPAKKRLMKELAAAGPMLARRYAAHRLVDGLYALWRADDYPRVPRQTAAYAAQARDAGLLDDDEYGAIVPASYEIDVNDWMA
jgi:Zn-dependent peptidase ImmA (M78 family)